MWISPQSMQRLLVITFTGDSNTSFKILTEYELSEPKSILAPEKELSREELEALIAEHGQESR